MKYVRELSAMLGCLCLLSVPGYAEEKTGSAEKREAPEKPLPQQGVADEECE